jgi:hypothetical protein
MTLPTKLKITAVMAAVLMAIVWAAPVDAPPQRLADERLTPLAPSAP